MSNKLKIDTTLLKKLVVELDNFLSSAQEIKESASKLDKEASDKLIIELQKAAGLAAGAAQEATALIMDIGHEVKMFSAPDPMDILSNALLKSKPPTGGFGGSFN